VVGDLKFAHFTITDVSGKRFRFQQKTSRGAFGESGFEDGNRLAWIDDWTLVLNGEDKFELNASMKGTHLHLQLRPRKPPVIHGQAGVSVKASGADHASHYYSSTRMETSGELSDNGKSRALHGESWFDHEWATNQLAPDQVGWDWLSVHFDDNTELMLYQMRLENGQRDPSSSGTLVAPDGSSTHLAASAYRMTATDFWKSDVTGARYPIGWRIELPEYGLECTVRAALANQELALQPLAYWEGAVEINASRNGKPIKGNGYLELTGYAGPLRELQR
jgi:predicted secreted hydrolase